MPVAEKFSTLGLYNGFPYCSNKVDVSDYFLTAPLTLAEISQIYWNTYALRATATSTPSVGPVIEIEDVLFDILDDQPYQPKNRVCGGGIKGPLEVDGVYAVEMFLDTRWGISKMYDGEVTDEANFIGYGMGIVLGEAVTDPDYSTPLALAGGYEDGGQGRVGVSRFLVSACQFDPDGTYVGETIETRWFLQYSILGLATGACTATTTTVSGLPFVALNWDGVASGSPTAAITALEFYTY